MIQSRIVLEMVNWDGEEDKEFFMSEDEEDLFFDVLEMSRMMKI